MKGGCGFPMGPFALLDLVGLDTSLAILDALYEEFRDPNYAPVPLLSRMVAAENLGRKSGKGFYDYRRYDTAEELSAWPRPRDPVERAKWRGERQGRRIQNRAPVCERGGVAPDPDSPG